MSLRVIDPGPIAYRDLPCAGDEDLERQLDARYGGHPDGYRFRLIDLPLEAIADQVLADPAGYDDQADGPARRAIAEGYRDAYLAGDDPDPIVVSFEPEQVAILDGFHRGAGARAAGRVVVAAYELLPD